MFSLFNFSSIFPGGGQPTQFAPMCGRPCLSRPSDRIDAAYRCKKRFFTFFNVFIFLQTFFILKKVDKVQSGKQINKKHFQNSSNETDQ